MPASVASGSAALAERLPCPPAQSNEGQSPSLSEHGPSSRESVENGPVDVSGRDESEQEVSSPVGGYRTHTSLQLPPLDFGAALGDLLSTSVEVNENHSISSASASFYSISRSEIERKADLQINSSSWRYLPLPPTDYDYDALSQLRTMRTFHIEAKGNMHPMTFRSYRSDPDDMLAEWNLWVGLEKTERARRFSFPSAETILRLYDHDKEDAILEKTKRARRFSLPLGEPILRPYDHESEDDESA